MSKIVVLYYSRYGATAKMAEHIAHGIEKHPNAEAIIRTVANVSSNCEKTEDTIPDAGPPYVSIDDLRQADGLIIGSPTRFGNMAAAMKHFLEQTTTLWMSGELVGKPAGVFTSSSTMHGGQESTLLTMMVPLFHQGMVMVGAPYAIPELNTTQTGGTPYGPSHVAGAKSDMPISEDEKAICIQYGEHFAKITEKLAR